jgi:hypothetical protein
MRPTRAQGNEPPGANSSSAAFSDNGRQVVDGPKTVALSRYPELRDRSKQRRHRAGALPAAEPAVDTERLATNQQPHRIPDARRGKANPRSRNGPSSGNCDYLSIANALGNGGRPDPATVTALVITLLVQEMA